MENQKLHPCASSKVLLSHSTLLLSWWICTQRGHLGRAACSFPFMTGWWVGWFFLYCSWLQFCYLSKIHDPVPGALKIQPHHKFVIVEGMFLLLTEGKFCEV